MHCLGVWRTHTCRISHMQVRSPLIVRGRLSEFENRDSEVTFVVSCCPCHCTVTRPPIVASNGQLWVFKFTAMLGYFFTCVAIFHGVGVHASKYLTHDSRTWRLDNKHSLSLGVEALKAQFDSESHRNSIRVLFLILGIKTVIARSPETWSIKWEELLRYRHRIHHTPALA